MFYLLAIASPIYNNSLHGRLRDLVRASDNVNTTSNTFRAITISGAYLSQHEAGLKGIVDEKSWDVVILQGQSTEPIDPEKSENFQNTTRKYAKIIRNSGAEPLLFMTWAYKDKPEMTQRLSDAYTILANEIGGMVIPVGLAFERALKVKPNLRLHIEDNKHPTLEGTYLSACVFYAALYDDSPIGNEYDAGLDSKMVAFLQEIAWATVNDFYKR